MVVGSLDSSDQARSLGPRRTYRRKTEARQEHPDNWAELHEAHLKAPVEANKPGLALLAQRTLSILNKRNQLAIKNFEAECPLEQARLRWHQLFTLATTKVNMKENQALVGLKTVGGVEIDEVEEHNTTM